MNESPVLSIITVTFNADRFIERTIESVTSQTWTKYEHIIVDGGSKDKTLSILQNYKSTLLKVITEPDDGLYDAMNKGISLASGKYILFLNAGDKLADKNVLNSIFKLAVNQDFIYGDTLVYNDEGEVKPYHKTKPKQDVISHFSFLNGMVICHQSMIVKKEIAKYFDYKSFSLAADIDWAIKVSKNAKSFLDTGITISHFLEGGVSSQNRWKAVKQRFLISIKHFGVFLTIFTQLRLLIKYTIK